MKQGSIGSVGLGSQTALAPTLCNEVGVPGIRHPDLRLAPPSLAHDVTVLLSSCIVIDGVH